MILAVPRDPLYIFVVSFLRGGRKTEHLQLCIIATISINTGFVQLALSSLVEMATLNIGTPMFAGISMQKDGLSVATERRHLAWDIWSEKNNGPMGIWGRR
ncbi:hypothetical protein [Phyllobacterium sp. P30BS-XVII]|uniref:hypothetical protein n=1 Tax=Phyllobacterium sp. P30BS-XVII TaxID=2587046 RepID=UPI000DD8AA81|nr:hypothetical protein [Phyllobacterium sp. P30BS-XVII]MBA8903245.1 hypothetical protein [Phyllobacterium sp. P30BS-XVII]